MIKIVRRIILLAALLAMGLCVVILRGIVNVDVPDGVVLLVGVVAGVIALASVALEFRRAVYHPEPEDPPGSDRIILPREPEDEQMEQSAVPPGKVMEKTAKAVDTAETFIQKANGRVRISLEMDEDEQDD
jgi:hypothetical protein